MSSARKPRLAGILAISEPTVRQYLATGVIRGFRLDDTPRAQWRIRSEALDAYLTARHRAA